MRWIFKILLYLLFFFIGIEYVLVLPSLNKYLSELGVGSSYIGVCLGALNFAALVTNIPFGKLADNKDNVRWVGASLALCGAIGNAIYMCIPRIEAVIFSRVMSGITSSIEPILFGILGRITPLEQRSAVMAEHMLAREMGLIVGPALNALFGNVNVRLSDSIVLTEYTMPAAFLGTSWIILAILLLIFYGEPDNPNDVVGDANMNNNVPNSRHEGQIDEGFELQSKESVAEPMLQNGSRSRQHITRNLGSTTNPFQSLTNSQFNLGNTQGQLHVSNVQSKAEIGRPRLPPSPCLGRWSFLLTDAFVVVMVASFAVMFFESSLETILTPITAKFFDWNTTQNSLCYVGIGLTVLVGYFVLMIAQKKCNLEDRLALLIGSAGIFVCMISVLFTWPIGFNKSGTGTPWLFPVFCIEIGFGVFFLPFLLVPPASLLSKIAPSDQQSFLQATRMTFQKTSMVLGPLWGSYTLWNIYFCVAAPLFMTSLVLVLTCLSYNYLSDDRVNFQPYAL